MGGKMVQSVKLDNDLHIDIKFSEDMSKSNMQIDEELYEVLEKYKGNNLILENDFLKITMEIKKWNF